MGGEILTVAEVHRVDQTAAADGVPLFALMTRAGEEIASEVLKRFGIAARVHVLVGPGNNGGDGWIAAKCLRLAGVEVCVWQYAAPPDGTAAAHAVRQSGLVAQPLSEFAPRGDDAVIDAIFGAGLSRSLDAGIQAAARRTGEAMCPVVAVDLPTGVDGDTGRVTQGAFRADLTITFVRKKPGHLLQPGRGLCGEILLRDIDIPAATVAGCRSMLQENLPSLWRSALPVRQVDLHKYRRGHVAVVSGSLSSTGAARLSAMAAARIGAGAVTLLSPSSALAVNAAHLTSIILRPVDTSADVLSFLDEKTPHALVFGPGLDPGEETAAIVFDILGAERFRTGALVLDAGALTSLATQTEKFFRAVHSPATPTIVLTPHDGEFARLFPDLAETPSKVERARAAAVRANAVIICKGPDTVIASPDGRAAINSNGTSLLATAGSGDVLSGIVAGLIAQGMAPFEGCAAAVWIHSEGARRFGLGLIAEDLPAALLPVIRELEGSTETSG